MSVVVRMEMPEKCGKCPLAWYDGAGPCFCMVSLERNDAVDDGMMWKEAEPNKKPQWCPIICSLPEGHGELIERQPIIQFIEDGLNRGEYGHDQIEVMTEVFVAETIVPAERSEE